MGRARDEPGYHVEQVDGLEDQVGLAQSELAQATTDVERLKVSVVAGPSRLGHKKVEKLKVRLEETAAKIAAENAVTEKLDKTAREGAGSPGRDQGLKASRMKSHSYGTPLSSRARSCGSSGAKRVICWVRFRVRKLVRRTCRPRLTDWTLRA